MNLTIKSFGEWNFVKSLNADINEFFTQMEILIGKLPETDTQDWINEFIDLTELCLEHFYRRGIDSSEVYIEILEYISNTLLSNIDTSTKHKLEIILLTKPSATRFYDPVLLKYWYKIYPEEILIFTAEKLLNTTNFGHDFFIGKDVLSRDAYVYICGLISNFVSKNHLLSEFHQVADKTIREKVVEELKTAEEKIYLLLNLSKDIEDRWLPGSKLKNRESLEKTIANLKEIQNIF